MKRITTILLDAILCVYLVVGGSMPVQASRSSSHSLQQAAGVTNIYLPLVMRDYNSFPTIIPDTTKILGATSSQDLTSVSADGSVYTFSGTTPELQNLKVGDIMIGDVSPAAPYGFLRQVTAISSTGGQLNAATSAGQSIITTIGATIEQAFQQISFQTDVSLTPQDIPIVDKVLYDADGNLNTTFDQVVANGDISLSPIFHLGLTIQNFHLQNLTFSITGQETASLSISSGTELSTKKQYDFPPIILGAIPTPIGPIVPELTFYVGVDGSLHAGVSTGITDTFSMTTGVRYDQGQWGNIASQDNSFTYTPPTFSTNLNAKGYVGTNLSFMVDGVAGPHAEIEAYLRLAADPLANPTWTLYGGLSGKAGVAIDIFSIVTASYNADLFDFETIIAPPPTVDVKVNGSDGPVNLTTQDTFTVSWTSTNANSCISSEAMAGQSGLSGNYTDGPKTVGDYTYIMSCTNVSGSASNSVLVSIVNPILIPVIPVSAGNYYTCALTQVGGVKCWGRNYFGGLGDGTTIDRHTPVDVVGLATEVSAISTGTWHTCALTTAGGIKCWGWNGFGVLGDGTGTNSPIPVNVVGLESGVKAISTGYSHTCALTQAGGVKCWGDNRWGQLGDGTTSGKFKPTDVIGLATGVSVISAGDLHTCALMQAGGVKCWGDNGHGQLGDGTTTERLSPVDVIGLSSGVSSISGGELHTCALTQAGGVKCWGWNGYGQLGDGATTDLLTPVDVVGLVTGVSAISAGYGHTCVLMQAGGAKCWGKNLEGQLGDGTNIDSPIPVNVVGLESGVSVISAGDFHTCALMLAGGIKCWGWNDYGELGDGTTTPRLTPVYVIGFP
jgi:alpha-tubulin suppressor-like RCC1 family protein